jgi:hypothetical protein
MQKREGTWVEGGRGKGRGGEGTGREQDPGVVKTSRKRYRWTVAVFVRELWRVIPPSLSLLSSTMSRLSSPLPIVLLISLLATLVSAAGQSSVKCNDTSVLTWVSFSAFQQATVGMI